MYVRHPHRDIKVQLSVFVLKSDLIFMSCGLLHVKLNKMSTIYYYHTQLSYFFFSRVFFFFLITCTISSDLERDVDFIFFFQLQVTNILETCSFLKNILKNHFNSLFYVSFNWQLLIKWLHVHVLSMNLISVGLKQLILCGIWSILIMHLYYMS